MKTILSQLGRYKKDTILTPVFTALEVIMEVMLPFITAMIIDDGLQEENMKVVYQYGLVTVSYTHLDVYKRQVLFEQAYPADRFCSLICSPVHRCARFPYH